MSRKQMPDAHYINPKLAEIYDVDSPWSIDRDFYLSLAGSSRQKILDLGCGTGLLCDAYAAKGHDVTGLDPSSAMLDVARRKPNGRVIEWIESRAQDYQSQELFDLIIMCWVCLVGLFEDEDILSTFSMVRGHLNSGGRFGFESRNPLHDWAKEWDYEMDLEVDSCRVKESRTFIAMKNDRMTFELSYEFPDEKLVSASELRFLSREEIEKFLNASGLQVDQLFGDWNREPFDERTSPELIFIAETLH